MTNPIVVGFTGTSRGMTEAQKVTVKEALQLILGLFSVSAVHGDCVGADDDFDAICEELGVERGIRPCTYENMRARCDGRRGVKALADPVAPMQRNRDIVADADVLIATPPNDVPIKRGSGTWATIGFGKRKGIEVIVVLPDGTAEHA